MLKAPLSRGILFINLNYLIEGLSLQIGWCIIMYIIGKTIYSFGVKQYEAFGS